MKRIVNLLPLLCVLSFLCSCTSAQPQNQDRETNAAETTTAESVTESDTGTADYITIRITVGATELYAELENNATTSALIEQMPMTLPMQDLYGREMCYRYGADALPTDELRSDRYEVGDIAYWPPAAALLFCMHKTESSLRASTWGILNPAWKFLKRLEM